MVKSETRRDSCLKIRAQDSSDFWTKQEENEPARLGRNVAKILRSSSSFPRPTFSWVPFTTPNQVIAIHHGIGIDSSLSSRTWMCVGHLTGVVAQMLPKTLPVYKLCSEILQHCHRTFIFQANLHMPSGAVPTWHLACTFPCMNGSTQFIFRTCITPQGHRNTWMQVS